MKKWFALMAMTVAVAVSGNALAHGAKPKHGGSVREVNDLQFELVNKNKALTIYVDDHEKPFSTAGASGKLTVLSGSVKHEFGLEPMGDNMLGVKAEVDLQKGSKAVAQITFANKQQVSVRFSVK